MKFMQRQAIILNADKELNELQVRIISIRGLLAALTFELATGSGAGRENDLGNHEGLQEPGARNQQAYRAN
jgi:hypothetical protein